MLSKNRDLTTGSITAGLWAFAIPLMLGNVLQQFYNLADTWVVGKYIGDGALAAVGSSYTLLTFLTSIVIGLSLGTGAFVSMAFGRRDDSTIRSGVYMSAVLIGGVTLIMTALFYLLIDPIISALLVPEDIVGDMRTYLSWVFVGFFATALYNYVSNLLRSMGNSAVPLIFLGVSVVLNVGLDLLFVIPLGWGIAGAAAATVIAQYASGIGITVYFLVSCREFCPRRKDMRWDWQRFRNILSLSGLTCLQQSVMNLGILMVQAVVNSFGPVVMAAFAVAVGVEYLRTEGACYIGIGILFMMYGYYRAVNKPFMSVVLTVISLGTRVLLANVLSAVPEIGVFGIWIAIPIGWFLADAVGAVYFALRERRRLNYAAAAEK